MTIKDINKTYIQGVKEEIDMKTQRTFTILIITIFLWIFAIGNALADDTIYLQHLPSSTYGGYYVGAVSGNLNGGTTTNFYCDDFSTTTYVPSSFAVAVTTGLSNLTQTKFGSTSDSLFKYQEMAWLVSQMESHPSEVGAIQFAAWSIFTPSAMNNLTADQKIAAGNWVTAAGNINAAEWDFSSVKIYTATNTVNQEFISGGAHHQVPEASSFLLLGLSIIGIVVYKEKFDKA